MSTKSIKNIKPSHKSGYIQGYFEPINNEKYIGDRPIIYRSSYEKKFAIYCDTNPNITKWSSEPFAIKYFSNIDNKHHTYFPDFYLKIKRSNGYDEYVVEVKPKSQLTKPKPPKKNTQKAILSYKRAYLTYVLNYIKINALKKFAESRNYKILLITEKSWMI
jgi:hypothetical protein